MLLSQLEYPILVHSETDIHTKLSSRWGDTVREVFAQQELERQRARTLKAQVGDGVEDYEESRRMYGGIMAREHPVEFRVDD